MGKVGFSGRLKRSASEEATKYVNLPRLKEAAKYFFKKFLLINEAHVVMLTEQEIIGKKEAANILAVLKEIDRDGIRLLELDETTDLYMNIEAHVIRRTHEETGGKIHIGRSRNDLYATAIRMVTREKINDIMGELLRLIRTELKVAEQNLETVMPGYTHLQHAQPITLAHYFVGHSDSLMRDVRRLEQAYQFTNLNPLGAAALATTGFRINRKRTTELLGFDRLIENSLDAVASKDYAVDVLYTLSMAASDVSRLTEDLILWNTSEFNMIEIADEYAGTSSIMPQKRNPYILEICRAKTGRIYGGLVAVLTIMKAIPFTHCLDEGQEVSPILWGCVKQFIDTVHILASVVSSTRVNSKIMKERANKGFSTATELADTIVRRKGLSFRSAYNIVSLVVGKAFEEGMEANEITNDMIDEAAMVVLGKPLKLAEKDVQLSLDPLENVRKRDITGGPAPMEVKRMIRERKRRIKYAEEKLQERKRKLIFAEKELNEEVNRIVRIG